MQKPASPAKYRPLATTNKAVGRLFNKFKLTFGGEGRDVLILFNHFFDGGGSYWRKFYVSNLVGFDDKIALQYKINPTAHGPIFQEKVAYYHKNLSA